MEEWYRKWFDSPYYDILYKDRDQEEADRFIHFLVKHLSPPKDALMLDLACGKGRYSIALNQQGYHVTGLDLSPIKINEAKKAISYQLMANSLSFALHDMRNPYVPEKYDYVFNLFTSFGYFDNEKENKLVLTHIYNSLKKGGIFVLDYVNSENAAENVGVQNFEPLQIDGVYFNLNKYIKNNVIIKEITVKDGNTEEHFTEKVRIFPEAKLKEYITDCGFTILETFGDYRLNKFDVNQSPRLIIISEK